MLSSSPVAEIAPSRSTSLDRWIAARVQRLIRTAPISFVLWDGHEIPPAGGRPVGSIVFRKRAALARWLWDAELNFGNQ